MNTLGVNADGQSDIYGGKTAEASTLEYDKKIAEASALEYDREFGVFRHPQHSRTGRSYYAIASWLLRAFRDRLAMPFPRGDLSLVGTSLRIRTRRWHIQTEI